MPRDAQFWIDEATNLLVNKIYGKWPDPDSYAELEAVVHAIVEAAKAEMVSTRCRFCCTGCACAGCECPHRELR